MHFVLNPTFLLLLSHFLLLLRQSLLLLRPLCDRPYRENSVPGRGDQWTNSYLLRIRLHGSGAALAALPLLGLLLYRPPELALLIQRPAWLALAALWGTLGLSALVATRFQHFSGLLFSSRDASPADFGRRWPLWPDTALWLCEMLYLALVYGALELLMAEAPTRMPEAWPELLLLNGLRIALLWVYLRNWLYRRSKGFEARIVDFRRISVQEPLYLMRLRLQKPNVLSLPILPMSFCVLRLPQRSRAAGHRVARWQQNEHPLSILSWRETEEPQKEPKEFNASGERALELEFALEMQGFLRYYPPQDIARHIVSQQPVRLWGPYYDVRPRFLPCLGSPEPSGGESHLLYIGCQSGLSPLLQYLQYLQERWGHSSSGLAASLELAVFHLCPSGLSMKNGKGRSATQFWIGKLEQARQRTGLNMQLQHIPIPPYLSRQFCRTEVSTPNEMVFSAGRSKWREQRRQAAWQAAWQSFRTECESELLQELVSASLSELSQQWALSHRELEASCLYRIPYGLKRVLEKCFRESS